MNVRIVGPREDGLFDLPQDGRKAPEFCAGHRHLRFPHDRAQRDRLLHRAGRAAPALQAGAGPVQGPHRHCQGQRLPVAAHHAGRPVRHQRRVPVAHRRDECGGRIRRRRALAVQGQPCTGGRQRRPAGQRVAAVAARHPATKRAMPPSSGTTSRSTCSPTRSMCSRPRARSWRCRAAPRWWTSPTPSTATWATARCRPRSTASRCRCAPN